MSDYDLLDVLELVACCFDCCPQLVLWFVANAGEDVADYRAPYFRVIFAAAGFPEDEAFMRMVN